LVTSTSNNANFSQPSFSQSLSSATLNGGSDGVPGSLATSWPTLYFYDTRDNLKCIEQHGNVSSTGCSSDPSNDATSRWRVRRFTYDSLGHLLTSKNPENGTITYQYDSAGRLSTRTDARGIVVTYQYRDTANGGVRLTDIIYSDGTPASRLRYDYATYNNNTLSNPVGRQNVTLSENGAKYLTSYDAMGRAAAVQQCTPGVSVCQNFSANYNGLGEPLYMLYASGFQVNYNYDAAGRLTSAQDNAGFTYATTQPGDFLAAGVLRQFETPNFNYQVSYNNLLQPIEISAGTFFDKQYNYNAGANNGDVISITNMKDNGRSQTFTYDSLNRLVTAGDRKNWSDSYVYDPWANLTQKNPGTLQGESLQASADLRNHLTKQDSLGRQIYTYDPVGNLLTDGLHTYTYDAENRVKTVDGTTTYTYDGGGRRVSKSTGEHTWYGPDSVILAETDANGNWTNYVYAFGKRLARNTPRSAPNSPDIRFYVMDHLGSTNMFVDKDGKSILDDNDLYPWGGVVPGVGFTNSSNHFTFTGKERDGESNLDYFGARYYSSNLGRWTSADWSAVPSPVPYANFGDPQTLNLHAYVRNVPTVGMDADGHSPFMSELAPTGTFDWSQAIFGTITSDPSGDPIFSTGGGWLGVGSNGLASITPSFDFAVGSGNPTQAAKGLSQTAKGASALSAAVSSLATTTNEYIESFTNISGYLWLNLMFDMTRDGGKHWVFKRIHLEYTSKGEFDQAILTTGRYPFGKKLGAAGRLAVHTQELSQEEAEAEFVGDFKHQLDVLKANAVSRGRSWEAANKLLDWATVGVIIGYIFF
jgi:RHS repeat-associated protein